MGDKKLKGKGWKGARRDVIGKLDACKSEQEFILALFQIEIANGVIKKEYPVYEKMFKMLKEMQENKNGRNLE